MHISSFLTLAKLGVGVDFVSILPLGKKILFIYYQTHFDYVVLSENMEQDSLCQMFLPNSQ